MALSRKNVLTEECAGIERQQMLTYLQKKKAIKGNRGVATELEWESSRRCAKIQDIIYFPI